MGQPRAHRKLVRNLVLIGGRGCGKSSIAKRLARANRGFLLFSLDALIRYEAGAATIPEIVDREGWKGFRRRELQVVRKVAAFESGALIDAGGGIVVDLDRAGRERYAEAKVEALRRHGRVVYLHRSIEYLERRIGADADRPALASEETFRAIMERRDPWYRRAADLVLDCRERAKSQLAAEILEWFYASQHVSRDEA